MDDKQSRKLKMKRTPEGRDPRFPVRVILIWLLVLIVVPVLLRLRQYQQEHVEEIAFWQLEQKVDQGLVSSFSFDEVVSEVVGWHFRQRHGVRQKVFGSVIGQFPT